VQSKKKLTPDDCACYEDWVCEDHQTSRPIMTIAAGPAHFAPILTAKKTRTHFFQQFTARAKEEKKAAA
jgi:hypothetical protein